MDRKDETGQASAEAQAVRATTENGHVTKVFLSGEVARAMGYKYIRRDASYRPYVSTEPMPASIGEG